MAERSAPIDSNLLSKIVFELEFTEDWLNIGLISTPILEQIAQEYLDEKHINPDPKHYRYRVFRRFMDQNRDLPELHFDGILDLTEYDADPELRETIISDLIDREECPIYILKRIANTRAGVLREKALAKLQTLQP
ncbi:hypothetical protein [Deinococcus cellulosilyticus]|nr:hypothetical protein [Deinococcus cellulosilyticus]